MIYINVQEPSFCISLSRCLLDNIICKSYVAWRKINLWYAQLCNPYKVKVYVKFCQKCMELVEIFWKGTNIGMEYWETFWFYVTLKVAKVFRISIFIKTFKELVSSLLDSSIKLSRFLIKWLNDLIKVMMAKKYFLVW